MSLPAGGGFRFDSGCPHMELADIRYSDVEATAALDDPAFQAFRATAWAHLTWLGLVNEELREAAADATKRSKRASAQPVVYFVQQGTSGPIKIGCTRNFKTRLNSLQTSAAETLTVIGTVPGGFELERELHAALDDYRLSGEWFKPTPAVLRTIKRQIALPGAL